eukprot:6559720-Heterocapsa_arctica.AAC.2
MQRLVRNTHTMSHVSQRSRRNKTPLATGRRQHHATIRPSSYLAASPGLLDCRSLCAADDHRSFCDGPVYSFQKSG